MYIDFYFFFLIYSSCDKFKNRRDSSTLYGFFVEKQQ